MFVVYMTSSLKSSTLPPLLGSYCAARFAAQRCTISLSTSLLLINPYPTNMCKYAIMQIGKCANMQICKLAYMQICNIMQVGKYSNMRTAVTISPSIPILLIPFPQIWRSIFFCQIYHSIDSLQFHEYEEMVLVSHYRFSSDCCLVITCSATILSSTF